ncbi:MAG: protease inhibitor I42 family protein, partial [Lentisphaerota bacterium]
MNKLWSWLLVLGAVTGMSMAGACAADREAAPAVTMTDSNNGGSMEIAVGSDLVVTVEGNPTTGYQWQLESEEQPLPQSSADPEYDGDSKQIGSGGLNTVNFTALAAGQPV